VPLREQEVEHNGIAGAVRPDVVLLPGTEEQDQLGVPHEGGARGHALIQFQVVV